MFAQSLGCVEAAGKLSLGEVGVDDIVANLMEPHSRPAFAAFELWDQVMERLLGLARDFAKAERADWCF